MTLEEWLNACRAYSGWRYCYPDLVDDDPAVFQELYEQGMTISEAVLQIGDNLDLDDVTQNWGIHQNVPCPVPSHLINATK